MPNTITSYGSITITDLMDSKEFSVNISANLPLTIVYNPDQNSYTPNWSTDNLTLNPILYYGNDSLLPTDSHIAIAWQRQEGIGEIGALTTGETVSDGVLTVSQNKFTPNSSMITYHVTATYTDNTTSTTLLSEAQITFGLIKQSTTIRSCSITGDTVFKYDTNQSIVGPSAITLTAVLNNVTMGNWQYQKSDGTYENITGATNTTYVVQASDTTIFNGDKAVIKLKTNNDSIYDIHTIVKLRDGAAGAQSVSAVLTNDDQMIPYSPSGVGDFSSANSQVIIYEGGIDKTSTWTVTVSYQGCTGTTSTTTTADDTVHVDSLTADTGNVTFKCEKSGYTTIYKTFSLVKVESGADGVSPTIYSVEASSYALNKNTSGVLTPSSVTFNAYSQQGETKSAYSGRFTIFENITLEEYDAASTKPQPEYSSISDESSYSYTPTSSANTVLCVLYKSNSSPTVANRLDSQLVVITSDGANGQNGQNGQDGKDGKDGAPGVSAINIILGNEADVIPCNTNNTTQVGMIITIPFYGYKGITRIPVTVNNAPNLFGTIQPNITNSTATVVGSVSYTVSSNTAVPDATGVLPISFVAEGQTITKEYRWTRNTAAANGENATILQLSTPKGNYFDNGTGTLDIKAFMLNGTSDVTSSATYQWAKYNGTTYVNISDETGKYSGTQTSTLTVYAAVVDSYASFRCTATYSSNDYVQYYSLFDKNDPLQAVIYCSMGSQIKNGLGYGTLYCKITRNGEEVDPIYSERFLSENPTTATTGDYYYKLNPTNGTVNLMVYNGSSWVASSNTYQGVYKWSYRNKDGEIIANPPFATSGKVIYIDGTLVDEKIVIDVEVTY